LQIDPVYVWKIGVTFTCHILGFVLAWSHNRHLDYTSLDTPCIPEFGRFISSRSFSLWLPIYLTASFNFASWFAWGEVSQF
jgi:hypothetical protein